MRVVIALYGAFALFLPSELSGQDATAVIAMARNGGLAFICRHAITDQTFNEVEPVNYADSLTQRRLSAEGARQSRDMGEAIGALGIPVGEVVASPMHRALRTAELIFGRATIDSAWHTNGSDYSGAPLERRRRVLSLPIDRGNLFIISHVGTIGSVLPGTADRLEEGDCVAIRPGAAQFETIGVVPWRAWIRAASAR
jgi:phosphohistidine phosphatase SixA